MKIADNPNLCSGCMACEQACPCNAIDEKEDNKGFLVPEIDTDKCINCGICKKVCPANNEEIYRKEKGSQEIYGGWLKADHLRMESQSGGAFTAFAQVILENKGVVYGVALEEDNIARYVRITSEDELYRLKGSKYVQAYTGLIFSSVQKDINSGKKVLFSGTACHIAGLLHFIPEKEQKNLYTCDLVCHGVPSPKVFRDYINYMEGIHNTKISRFNFRDKEKGWQSHVESFCIESDKKVYSRIYAELFGSTLMFRESCFCCRYASFERIADLTVGDFWGIENAYSEYEKDSKGYSLIMVNSSKGKEIFRNAKTHLFYFETDRKSCEQLNLLRPTERPEGVNQFWKYYNSRGFRYILQKYTSLNIKKRIWRKVRKIIKSFRYYLMKNG